MRSGQLSNMHRPRFAYACTRRQHSLGPETRNPNAHYCTLSGRNDRRRTHVFKMLADSIEIANGSSAKARVALRNLLSESAVQHWNENAYRLRACRTQQLAIYLRDMPLKGNTGRLAADSNMRCGRLLRTPVTRHGRKFSADFGIYEHKTEARHWCSTSIVDADT